MESLWNLSAQNQNWSLSAQNQNWNLSAQNQNQKYQRKVNSVSAESNLSAQTQSTQSHKPTGFPAWFGRKLLLCARLMILILVVMSLRLLVNQS